MELTEKQNQILKQAQLMEADIFFFAEELPDYKIVLYKQSITELVPKKKSRDKLMTAVIIADFPMDNRRPRFLLAKYRDYTKEFFIKLDKLNEIWGMYSECIAYEISCRKYAGKKCGISKPEDILELKYLCDSTQEAVFEDRQIVLRKRVVDEQKLLLKSKRQSKMDARELLYAYSKEETIAHDKQCSLVAQIPDDQFEASHDLPEGYTICPKCARLSAIRRGCFPNTKEIPICSRFFYELHASTSCLTKIVDDGVTFHADNLGELVLKGKEDTWIIRNDNGIPILYHNNYVKLSDTERYITEGFHDQKWKGMPINSMLSMISTYTWQKHLEGVETARKREEFIAEMATKEDKKVAITEPVKCEMGILKRIWNRIKNSLRTFFMRNTNDL